MKKHHSRSGMVRGKRIGGYEVLPDGSMVYDSRECRAVIVPHTGKLGALVALCQKIGLEHSVQTNSVHVVGKASAIEFLKRSDCAKETEQRLSAKPPHIGSGQGKEKPVRFDESKRLSPVEYRGQKIELRTDGLNQEGRNHKQKPRRKCAFKIKPSHRVN